MKKLLSLIVVCAAVTATNSYAQTLHNTDQQTAVETELNSQDGLSLPGGFNSQLEILPLADVIGGMSEGDIDRMEATVTDTTTLTVDVQSVIEAAVSDAISDGFVAPDMRTDTEAAVDIANANAEFFDFDILDEIALLISEGEFTDAQIRSTLEGFNSLSDADKALVGQESFEATDGNALYSQVSAAGKTIIAEKMPVLL